MTLNVSGMSDQDLMGALGHQSSPDVSKPSNSGELDPSKMSDDEIRNALKGSKSDDMGALTAAGAGIVQGGSQAAQGLSNLAKEGIRNFTPGPVADVLGKGIQKATDLGINPINQAVSQNPDVQAAQTEHPVLSEVGNVIGQTAPYALPGLGAGKLANIGLGMAAGASQGQDLQGQAIGSATGGIISRGAYALGDLLKTGISALRAPNVVQDLSKWTKSQVDALGKTLGGTPEEIGAKSAANVYNATKAADDALFQQFRSVPTDFAHETYGIKRSAEDILDAHRDVMSGAQKQALQQVANLANQDSTIAGMHDIRKLLSSQYDNFSPKDGAIVSDAYKALKNQVNDTLEDMAQKGGVSEEYKNANQHFQSKMLPLINAKVNVLANALSEQGMKTDPALAGHLLDTWTDQNIRPDAPNSTKAVLNALDDNGRNALETRVLQRTMDKVTQSPNPATALKTELNKLGQTADQLFTDKNKQMIDGAKKILDQASPIMGLKASTGTLLGQVEAVPLKIISAAAATPEGQMMLRVLGEPGITKNVINNFLRQGASVYSAKLADVYNQSVNDNK